MPTPARTILPALALSAVILYAPVLSAQQATQPSAAPSAMSMAGLYGPYGMMREASGTSWQPDSTPMEGYQWMQGAWLTMLHGYADAIYDDQGGPRGATQAFTSSMLMLMARRDLTDGALGLRLMLSTDPLMGASGYPLLFQTGETADGRVPLIDRQHPHNLLMEAAASYSRDLSPASSAFVYAGPAGEPALGPTTFMHRLSAMDDPEAPLTHHWLDSTHISYGVVTAGYVFGQFKLDASAFNGHEPDQHRYDIEIRPLDSWAARLTWNAGADVSMQVSTGHLVGPEQLEPGVDVQRTTASVSYNSHALGQWWQTTLAWGRDAPSQGLASNGALLESALKLSAAQTVFGRAEHVAKDELFLPAAPLYGQSFMVNALSLGYIYDFAQLESTSFGVGGVATTYSFPAALNGTYGYRPTSFMLFARVRL